MFSLQLALNKTFNSPPQTLSVSHNDDKNLNESCSVSESPIPEDNVDLIEKYLILNNVICIESRAEEVNFDFSSEDKLQSLDPADDLSQVGRS